MEEIEIRFAVKEYQDEKITKLGEKLAYSENDFVRRTYAELIGEKRSG